MMRFFIILHLVASSLFSCRVTAPEISAKSPDSDKREEVARQAISDSLAPVTSSFATLSAISRRVTRNVSDTLHLSVEAPNSKRMSDSSQLLTASPDDHLTFEENDSSRFTYTLRNTTSLSGSYRVMSVNMLLRGRLVSKDGVIKVTDASLDIVRIRANGESVFHVMVQKPEVVGPEDRSEWRVDLNELNRFYREMAGEGSSTETGGDIQGVISIEVSGGGVAVEASGFELSNGNRRVIFDSSRFNLKHGDSQTGNEVDVQGRVLSDANQIGYFKIVSDPNTGNVEVIVEAGHEE